MAKGGDDRSSRSAKVAPGGESKSPKHKDKDNRRSKRVRRASFGGTLPWRLWVRWSGGHSSCIVS